MLLVSGAGRVRSFSYKYQEKSAKVQIASCHFELIQKIIKSEIFKQIKRQIDGLVEFPITGCVHVGKGGGA